MVRLNVDNRDLIGTIVLFPEVVIKRVIPEDSAKVRSSSN